MPAEHTLLALAGLADTDPSSVQRKEMDAIQGLAAVLEGGVKGRPRGSVATYYLPREVIEILTRSNAAIKVPTRLRAVLRKIVLQSRSKRGARLTLTQKLSNVENGYYSPETERRYRWEARKRDAAEKVVKKRRTSIESLAEDWPRPMRGSLGHVVGVAAARHQQALFALFGSRTDRRR